LPRPPLEIAEPALLIAMSGFETVPRPAAYEISNIANALAPTQPRKGEKFPTALLLAAICRRFRAQSRHTHFAEMP
jgi:hypothetical protein